MTKKKLLAKAKEMGLEVSDSLTKAQIQAAIDAAESAEVEETTEYEFEVEADTITEDDVVIEFTPAAEEEAEEAEEPVVEERVKAVADAQVDLVALINASTSELYAYAEEKGLRIHKGLSRKEAYGQIKKKIISGLKRPK